MLMVAGVMARGPAIVLVCVAVLAATGCTKSSISPTPPPAGNVTMAFKSLTADGAAVTIYSESGFSVSANPGNWVVKTTFGNPAPFVQFAAAAGNAVTGQIQVTAEGFQPFTFKSVDLYSSTTQIPYTIVGTKRAAVVFSVEGALSNTLGNFRTVVNPHGTDAIDTLTIILVNSAAACCSNPMGLDNIVLNQ